MVRIQIQLTGEQAQALKELSLACGESVAGLIRKAVDQLLVTGKPDLATLYRQAGAIVGKSEADRSDTAVDHDRYLEVAFDS